jgi:hypothetical protein
MKKNVALSGVALDKHRTVFRCGSSRCDITSDASSQGWHIRQSKKNAELATLLHFCNFGQLCGLASVVNWAFFVR